MSDRRLLALNNSPPFNNLLMITRCVSRFGIFPAPTATIMDKCIRPAISLDAERKFRREPGCVLHMDTGTKPGECPLTAHAPPGDIMMWASFWSRSPYVSPVELFMYSLERWVMSPPCVKRAAYIVWDAREKTR